LRAYPAKNTHYVAEKAGLSSTSSLYKFYGNSPTLGHLPQIIFSKGEHIQNGEISSFLFIDSLFNEINFGLCNKLN